MISDVVKKYSLKQIYNLRGEPVFSLTQNYIELDHVDSKSLADYKQYKLENLCRFASNNVPYYKQFGVNCSDFHLYPIVNKNVIRSNFEAFRSEPRRHSWRSTSGSTGQPFFFPKDRTASAHMDALMYHFYSWHGIQPADRQARIWGGALTRCGQNIQLIKDILLNRKRLPIAVMNDAVNKHYYECLLKFMPKYFYAYPGALYQFARSIERQQLSGSDLKIGAAICTGEVLFPFQREYIEKILCCKVINEYGSTENGIIAFECENGSMHVSPTLEVEITHPDSEGFGKVVITELNSFYFPFIRYEIGDIARWSQSGCVCGKPYRVLEIREGRIGSHIIRSDGSKIHSSILAYALKFEVEAFRGVQDSTGKVIIDIVPTSSHSPAQEKKILDRLNASLGDNVEVQLKVVKAIPPDRSGKLRYFDSQMEQ